MTYNVSSGTLNLTIPYPAVSRVCFRLGGANSSDIGQDVVSQSPVARLLRRRRSHLPGHVLGARRQSASQGGAGRRRRARPDAVELAVEAADGRPGCRARSRLPAARVQFGAGDGRLSAVARRGRPDPAVCRQRTRSRASNIIRAT